MRQKRTQLVQLHLVKIECDKSVHNYQQHISNYTTFSDRNHPTLPPRVLTENNSTTFFPHQNKINQYAYIDNQTINTIYTQEQHKHIHTTQIPKQLKDPISTTQFKKHKNNTNTSEFDTWVMIKIGPFYKSGEKQESRHNQCCV